MLIFQQAEKPAKGIEGSRKRGEKKLDMKTLALNQKWFNQHYVNKTLPKKTIYGIVKLPSQSPVNVEIPTRKGMFAKKG